MTSLGTRRVSWPNFEKIHVLNERENNLLCKQILDAKERFLLLLPDRQRIESSWIGFDILLLRCSCEWKTIGGSSDQSDDRL
jgi:hypothetical protein